MNKKLSVLALALCAAGECAWAQQLPNMGFDNWRSTNGSTTTTYTDLGSFTRPGEDPADWNGSNVTQASLNFTGLTTKGTETVDGATNTYVKLTNSTCGALGISSTAPGFISMGTPWVFAVTSVTAASSCLKYGDGGSYGGVAFTNRPDAISLRYRHTAANSEKAHVIAYLWSGTFTSKVNKNCKNKGNVFKPNWQVSEYMDLNDVDRAVMGKETESNVSAKGTLIASVDYEITDDASHWDEPVVIPISYNSTTAVPEKMNVIICAGDYWTRSNLQVGSTMDVDDVQFVYYKTLSALSVNGSSVALQDGVYSYDIDGAYSESDIVATTKSPFATTATSYDANTNVATVTVTANDGSTQEYKLNYKSGAVDAPDAKSVDGTYKSQIAVDVSESGATYSFNDVILTANDDNTVNFVLKGFSFSGTEIGNVNVQNVPIAWGADSTVTLTCTRNIDIETTTAEAAALGLTNLPMTLNATVNPKTKELSANLSITWQSENIAVTVVPQPFSYTLEDGKFTVTSGTISDESIMSLMSLLSSDEVYSIDLKKASVTTTMLGDLIDVLPNVTFYVAEDCTADGASKAVKGNIAESFTFTDSYTDETVSETSYPSLYIPEDFTAKSISYNREFPITDNYVSTFILPFGFAVPKGVTVGSLSRVDGGTLYFTEVEQTVANKPYVVITDKSNFVNSLTNVEVKANVGVDLTTTANGVKHVGVYAPTEVENVYGYSEGQFVKAATGTVHPFRTYIQMAETQAAPKAFTVTIENQQTGIGQVVGKLGEAEAPVYNLQGVRQNSSKLAKGVYIVNGKKIVK